MRQKSRTLRVYNNNNQKRIQENTKCDFHKTVTCVLTINTEMWIHIPGVVVAGIAWHGVARVYGSQLDCICALCTDAMCSKR